MAVSLSSVSPVLLPPTITQPIFQQTVETSAIMKLARQVPLSVNAATVIPVMGNLPVAGWVAENGIKPVGTVAAGTKSMSGKKVALIVPVSDELVMTNPAGLYDQLQRDLPSSIARAFDYAAIHGLDKLTGGPGPFADYLCMTKNSQVIGASTPAQGGVYADLWKGYSQVVNAPEAGYEFTGFACDTRLKPELALSVDSNGRPFFVDNMLSVNAGGIGTASLIGVPTQFNSAVSGKYTRAGDATQIATINGSPTGGTFTLVVGGASTGPLAYNATSATVQTAVQGIGAAGAGVTVTGSAGGPYTLNFPSGSAAQQIFANSALTGGSSPYVAVSQSAASDSGLRAIGGDFTQCVWGQGMDITIKVSNQASYIDAAGVTHSSFQENQTLLLVEAYYGFAVYDPNAFVAYTHAVGS